MPKVLTSPAQLSKFFMPWVHKQISAYIPIPYNLPPSIEKLHFLRDTLGNKTYALPGEPLFAQTVLSACLLFFVGTLSPSPSAQPSVPLSEKKNKEILNSTNKSTELLEFY